MLDNISFYPGRVTYNDCSLESDFSLETHLSSLKEDLLQVEFENHILLDVGWFPSFDPLGAFQIRVVQNHNWEKPILYSATSNYHVFRSQILNITDICRQLAMSKIVVASKT